MTSRKQILKELESIQVNLDRAYRKAERVSAKLDIPSLGELLLIKVQVEQLLEMIKSKENK